MTISSNVVLDPERLEREVQYFMKQPRFVFDIESLGEHRGIPQQNKVAWLSMSTFGKTVVIPFGHPNGDVMLEKPRRRKDPSTKKFITTPARWSEPPKQMSPATVFDILRPLFFNEEIEKGAHNAPMDFISVYKYFGAVPPGPYHDTIVQAWLINENRRLGLKDLTEARYKRKYDDEHVGRRIENFPFWKVANYAYLDSTFTFMHQEYNLEVIEDQGLRHVYDLEMDVLKVLFDMEVEGMPVDQKAMQTLEPLLAKRQDEAAGRFYKAVGKQVNLNSPKQKTEVLYSSKEKGGQGLKPWKLTDGGMKKAEKGLPLDVSDYSTDSESLEGFAGKNKAVDALIDYQEVDRVLGTYVRGYLGYTPPSTSSAKAKPCIIFNGRVYPDFVQYGTVTGRFSCRSPNLQNIPRPDTELGKHIRSLFIAGEDHKLIVADYGQIELVILAHFVGKGALYEGFFQGIDPHTMTAALVFNVDPKELQARVDDGDPVAKGYRQAAKAINFAVVYGAGPDKVASMAGVSVTRAKQILLTHEREFPEIYKFKDRALEVCRSRKPPHLVTLEGRKRRLPAVNASNFKTRGKAERQAINSLIQGSAADVIKVAMIRLNNSLATSGTGGKLLLTVHDELVTRVHNDYADECAAVVREAMVGPGIQSMVQVPLNIDLKVVDKWSEAK